jgi:hypothetical protein
MAKLRINGDSSGYVDLEAPNAASSSTLDLDQVPQKNAATKFDTVLQVGSSSTMTNAYGAASGYVFDIKANSGSQSYMSIGMPADTLGSAGLVMGVDTSAVRITSRDDKRQIFSTNNIDRMIIHSTTSGGGAVTTPYQPAFWVQRSADYTGYNTGNYAQSVLYDSKIYDTGNNFNTSTGLFTAPITGHYLFTASAWATGSTTLEQSWITYNGARNAGTDWTSSGNPNGFTQLSAHVKMDANDTVGYHPYSSGNTIGIRSNTSHTWFKGILLG